MPQAPLAREAVLRLTAQQAGPIAGPRFRVRPMSNTAAGPVEIPAPRTRRASRIGRVWRRCSLAGASAHARWGQAAGIGLGFYAFTRFHVDARSFRRWGSAGPAGNQSPCAVLERGGDPEAPPLPPPVVVPVPTRPAIPAAPPATSGEPKPDG